MADKIQDLELIAVEGGPTLSTKEMSESEKEYEEEERVPMCSRNYNKTQESRSAYDKLVRAGEIELAEKYCKNFKDAKKDCLGGSDGLCPECRQMQSYSEAFINKITSEDTSQLIAVVVAFVLQLYQMSVGSLIIIFTPQLCPPTDTNPVSHACSFSENFEVDFPFYLVVLIMNFATFASFLAMYILELWREDTLIALMDVDEDVNNDGDDVLNRMNLLSDYEKSKISNLSKWYRWTYYSSAVLFFANAICSFIIVQHYTIGNQTDTTYVTNVLFMVKKIIDVGSTVSAEDNVFYSAYLLSKVQYNNVDSTIFLRETTKVGADGKTMAARRNKHKTLQKLSFPSKKHLSEKKKSSRHDMAAKA